MKKKALSLLVLLVGVTMLLSAGGQKESAKPSAAETSPVVVFNAASTTDLVNDIADLFTEATGIAVESNPASSGTLAHQLEQGAEADVYISASKKWMDFTKDLGITEEVSPFVKNRLVLIAPLDSPMEPFELTGNTDFPAIFEGRLSMGDPAHVPAGKYAEDALKYYGWYDTLTDRIQHAADVRAALMVVELGETELGIVYETDAMKSQKVKIVSRFPEESHTPIEYFVAYMKESNAAGKQFYDFLFENEKVGELYKKYGFSVSK